MALSDHLAVALATASFSPVFPALPDKRPATRRGFKDATDDPERITRWWTRHPTHLVAIPAEGLLVVDLDYAAPPEPDAWAWWVATAKPRGWDAATTPLVATPSGGWHIYFAAPEGASVRNSAGKLAPHVDVRGAGGYVIAPGSTLPDGRQYRLAEPCPAELPDAPDWLVELCTARSDPPPPIPVSSSDWRGSAYGLAGLERECGRLATSVNGTRNDRLNRAAHALGQLVAGGQLDVGHVAHELWVVAQRTGLGDREIEATIASGLRAGAQKPRRPPT